MPGFWEWVIILFIVLVVFGAGKIPDIGSSLGKGIKNFKKSLKEPDAIDITPHNNEKDKEKV